MSQSSFDPLRVTPDPVIDNHVIEIIGNDLHHLPIRHPHPRTQPRSPHLLSVLDR
jgi:hypothetical protein